MDEPEKLVDLSEARRVVGDPARSVPARMAASLSICESPDASLEDLVACLAVPERSATWHPATLLHERTGVPKCFDEKGWLIIDASFWREYLWRLLPAGKPKD